MFCVESSGTSKMILKIPILDEEQGGFKGMKPFVQTEEFKSLNVGFALDEGSATVNNYFFLMWAERSPWREYIS